MNEALAIAAACAVFIIVLAVCEWASTRLELEAELARKNAHIACGVVAACLPMVMALWSVAIVAGLFIPFMLVTRKVGIFPSVHRGEASSLGEIYFPLGVMFAALVAGKPSGYSFGVLVMGLSDAGASLAGRRFGKRSYRVAGAHKTVLGSGVFLVTSLVIALSFLAALGILTTLSAAGAVLVCCGLTVIEGLLGKGMDNAALPPAGALLFQLLS